MPAPASATPKAHGWSAPPAGLLARRRRPRISARLDATLEAATRLTLVSAPPGYGKSVAVAGWIADRGLAAAWVGLDGSAADPSRLARDVLVALEGVRPGTAVVAGTIGPGTTLEARALADLVVDAMAADDREAVLVLDDWHLADGPAADVVLRRLVDRLPPFAHLVVVTREDPDLPLGRLRAHGALVELRAGDLRFTVDEAAGLLVDAGIAADTDVLAGLVGRTEGWAAALQLATIAMRASADPLRAAGAVSGTHRFLIDYLGDEVMAGLDADLRDVLPRLSIADRFDARLGAVLTGRDDAAALVDRAERSNLFLVPLDDERRWFRMHGLFAGYLRARLTPAERRRLHGIAAAWLEAEGHGREALAHALEADDAATATRLVAREGRRALEAGELATLERWITALPAGARASDPDIRWLQAWARFYMGDLATAASLAGASVGRPEARLPAEGRLLVLAALVGTTTRQDAEALAQEGIRLVGDDPLFRSLGLQAAGLARLARGDVEGSLQALREAFAAARTAGLPMAVLPAVNPLGHALIATGRRDEAEAEARRVLDACRGAGEEPLPFAWPARLALGIALFEGGEVIEARGELEGGLAAAEGLGIGHEVLGWALPAIALARLATGDARGALAIVERGPAPAMSFPSVAGETEARIHLARGDVDRAARWADDAQVEAPPGSPLLAMLRASTDMTVARVRLGEGRLADALRALETARAAFEAWGTVPELVSALLLTAAARHATGDRVAALVELDAAMRLAAPGGYVRRFVDDGRSLAPLLGAADGVAPGFLARVRAALAEDAAARSSVRRGTTILVTPDGAIVESLTGRELDVLRRLATGASNAQLAADLGVSPGTAKWHVAHILAKLGSRSRTAAVVRGQELGLL